MVADRRPRETKFWTGPIWSQGVFHTSRGISRGRAYTRVTYAPKRSSCEPTHGQGMTSACHVRVRRVRFRPDANLKSLKSSPRHVRELCAAKRAPCTDTDKAARREVARGVLAYKFRPAINAREDTRRYDSGTDWQINCLALIKLRVFAHVPPARCNSARAWIIDGRKFN